MTQLASTPSQHQYLKQILVSLDPKIKIARSLEEEKRVETFRDDIYREVYPKTFKNKPDGYYNNGIHCYMTDDNDQMIATLSFAFECEQGLPDAPFFAEQIAQYQRAGIKYAEVGRMLVAPQCRRQGLAKRLFRFIYYAARTMGIERLLTLYKCDGLPFVTNIIGTRVLNPNTFENFGGKTEYAALEWRLDETSAKFFRWIADKPKGNKTVMDSYSKPHMSLTTSFQMALYRLAAKSLYGDVIDLGCGNAKMAPFLADKRKVTRYLGVDISKDMLTNGQTIIDKLDRADFSLRHGDVCDIQAGQFDCAVSLCSLQFWPDPQRALNHIYDLLKPNGIFVLGVPNHKQNLSRLIKEVTKEHIAHPDLSQFIESNKALAKQTAQFVKPESLKMMVEQAGFEVLRHHRRLYLGGLEFMELCKH